MVSSGEEDGSADSQATLVYQTIATRCRSPLAGDDGDDGDDDSDEMSEPTADDSDATVVIVVESSGEEEESDDAVDVGPPVVQCDGFGCTNVSRQDPAIVRIVTGGHRTCAGPGCHTRHYW